jgi:hypothetical protein
MIRARVGFCSRIQSQGKSKIQSPWLIDNRYAYAGNAPTKYTDPTGKIFGIDDLIVIFVASLITTAIQNNVSGGNFLSQLAQNFVVGVGLAAIGVGVFGAEGLARPPRE